MCLTASPGTEWKAPNDWTQRGVALPCKISYKKWDIMPVSIYFREWRTGSVGENELRWHSIVVRRWYERLRTWQAEGTELTALTSGPEWRFRQRRLFDIVCVIWVQKRAELVGRCYLYGLLVSQSSADRRSVVSGSFLTFERSDDAGPTSIPTVRYYMSAQRRRMVESDLQL